MIDISMFYWPNKFTNGRYDLHYGLHQSSHSNLLLFYKDFDGGTVYMGLHLGHHDTTKCRDEGEARWENYPFSAIFVTHLMMLLDSDSIKTTHL